MLIIVRIDIIRNAPETPSAIGNPFAAGESPAKEQKMIRWKYFVFHIYIILYYITQLFNDIEVYFEKHFAKICNINRAAK